MALPPHEVPRRGRITALYALFALSGFCGLIYESIWSHYLKLLLGHASYAQAVVLVVFVGGLALGAWLTGRFAHRIRQPLLGYAIVEAAVAAIAFGFHALFERASEWAIASFLPTMCGQPGPCSASWLLAAALILPASVLLGSTFPLMSTGVIRLGAAPGRGLSMLYFLNSAGAALGVLASGFVLIPALGLPGTMLVAGCGNAVVALCAYAIARIGAGSEAAPADEASRPAAAADRGELRLLLAVAALTGLSSFIYEVAWIRMLTLVLGAATHAFELMLAPFILGLAIGAWWIRNRIDASRDALVLLARIQVAMGLLAVATLPLYAACYDAMAWALRALARTGEGYALFNITSGLLASAVMLPATICAGMTLPLITALLLRRGHGERQVGQVYGVNTFGAIAGVLVAVHLLIPSVGLKWTLAAGAAIDVLLGGAIWLALVRQAARERAPRRQGASGFAWVGMALGVLVGVTVAAPLDPQRMASGVFRYGAARLPADQEVIFHRDGRTATVTVLQRANGVRGLLTNGKSDGGSHPQRKEVTPDDHTTILAGALGPLHHPGARTAAVIGLGTGTTSSVLLEVPALERVDTIEIEPMMVEAAKLFQPRVERVFHDPRSHIVIDDARAHFAKAGRRYDLIVSEPSNPWVSGVAGLFTREFYEHVAAHLAPGGHFVQWLQLYEASPEMVASIVRAFGLMFPEFKVYASNNFDVLLVARKDGRTPVLDRGALERLPGVRAELAGIGIRDMAHLAAHDTGRGTATLLLADSWRAEPNSDFYPVVDQRAASDRFRGEMAASLFSLRLAPVPLLEIGPGAPWFAGQVRSATQWMPYAVRTMASSWHGLRYLQGQPLGSEEKGYLGAWQPEYAAVRAWIASCRFPRGTGVPWTSLVRVASDLNAGLDARSAGAFWRGIADGPCRPSLDATQQAWIALFAAVGARQAGEVRTAARQVLALDQDLTPEARAYAVMAGVTGAMVTFRRAEAQQLLQQQSALLSADQRSAPGLRYLGAMLGLAPPPAP